MMVRMLRSGKLELMMFFTISSVLSALLSYAVWYWLAPKAGNGEVHLIAAVVFLLVGTGFGYWMAQRQQRRIDALHLALKQAANGNLAERIPETDAYSFTAVYREFNEMAASLEKRLQVMQRKGEAQVMREAASNEAAVLEERKRLARDLHDTVSQQLFAIHMSASSLPKLLELDRERAGDVMEQLILMSASAQKQMRGFIAKLRPLELEGRTLYEALGRWFPDYCRQNGLQGELDWRLLHPLSDAKEHQLFLIIQEAMANIVKHAGARSVSLSFSESDSQLFMTLQDDGAGFRADQIKAGSYGLSTMQERAQKIGGDASILSKPGAGTRIRVTIPKYGDEGEHYKDE